MSENSIASKWNARYAWSGDPVPAPAAVLSQGERWLPNPSLGLYAALDLACGRAGNGEWLGARGFRVTAWDISDNAINSIRSRRGSHIHIAERRNIQADPPDPLSFDVIVVSRFLDRQLCPMISAALKAGGVLFYQTFTKGLNNPNYLLRPGELPRLFSELTVLDYHETDLDAAGKAEARLVAKAIRQQS